MITCSVDLRVVFHKVRDSLYELAFINLLLEVLFAEIAETNQKMH